MLGDVRPVLRAVVSQDTELRLKGSLRRKWRRSFATPSSFFVHASAWKNASQWLKLVLSDPRLFSSHDFVPTPWRAPRAGVQKPMYLAVPVSPETLKVDLETQAFSGLYVFRDPIDQARSWYVSSRYTHPENSNLLRMRQRVEGLNDVDGFEAHIEYSYASVVEPMKQWLDAAKGNDALVPVSFEDLTQNPVPVLHHSLTRAGWRIEQDVLERVLGSYGLDRLKPKFASKGKYVSNRLSEERLPRTHVERVLEGSGTDVFEVFSELNSRRVGMA